MAQPNGEEPEEADQPRHQELICRILYLDDRGREQWLLIQPSRDVFEVLANHKLRECAEAVMPILGGTLLSVQAEVFDAKRVDDGPQLPPAHVLRFPPRGEQAD